jgi:hypothetical protein
MAAENKTTTSNGTAAPCFNEAAANGRGKPRAKITIPWTDPASMRPRRMAAENPMDVEGFCVEVELQ